MKASSKRNHFDVITDLTATMVWARFSYRYLTAANYMQPVDDRLPLLIATQRSALMPYGLT